MSPSRDYLIGQAVTNAAPKFMPLTHESEGTETVLKLALMLGLDPVHSEFVQYVREEYRALAARYAQ